MARSSERGEYWLKRARQGMERRGTVGKFGRATSEKIRKGLKSRSLTQVRRAAFAKAMRTIAARRRKSKTVSRRSARRH